MFPFTMKFFLTMNMDRIKECLLVEGERENPLNLYS